MRPFDGAYQRVRRAGIHLTNLNRRANAISQARGNLVIIESKPALDRLPDGTEMPVVSSTMKFPSEIETVPPIISLLVGEIIYNLRAALDYLIYDLARLDSGQVVKRTQFPIEDTVDKFERRRNTFLKGVSDEHVAAITKLQPCDGCNWTKTLASISNPDKHRHLTVFRSPVYITPSLGSAEPIIAIYIAFNDGTLVIDTLKQLKLKVAKTLDAFKLEFIGSFRQRAANED